MQEDKVLEVVGLSSAVLYDKRDPFNPINRRIAIVVMNQKAVDRILKEWSSVDVTDSQAAEELIETLQDDDEMEKNSSDDGKKIDNQLSEAAQLQSTDDAKSKSSESSEKINQE